MRLVIMVVAVLMAVYHLIYTQYLLQPAMQHINTHLAFCLVIVFLTAFQASTSKLLRTLQGLFIFLSLVATIYVHLFTDELMMRSWFSTPIDLAIGAILILLVLEATRRSFGVFIPLFCLAVVIYPFFGTHFPEPFHCTSLSVPMTISNLSVSLGGGIYGIALAISAKYVFLFVLFGGILQATGATKFFSELGTLAGSRLRSGPAMTSIMSSAAVGSITGSVAANIAITGSFTIPLMKKVGYKVHEAAAIEAAASNGGQIMPPVMGAVAFVMAGMTGVPYIRIVVMAILPAIFYFFSAGTYVQLMAQKRQIPYLPQKIDVKELLLSAPSFLGPLLVVTVLLIMGYSVMYVAFWAVISVVAISLIRKKTRPSLGSFVRGFTQGATTGAQVGVSCACIMLAVSTFTMSGLGIKLSSGIEAWSAGLLLPALLIIWGMCVILGMGVPSITSYIIVSIFAAPALMKMGVPLMQAHFFVMITAIFSFVTPPIAIAALIASRLAGAPYIKTAIEAVKVAAAGFLIPIMLIYCPILVLQPQESIMAVTGLVGFMITILALQFSFVGYCFAEFNLLERALFLIVAALLITFIILQNYTLFAAGVSVAGLLVLRQWKRKTSHRMG